MKTAKDIYQELELLYPGKFYLDSRQDQVYLSIYTDKVDKPIRREWNIKPYGEKYLAYSDRSRENVETGAEPKVYADTIEQLITKIQLIDP